MVNEHLENLLEQQKNFSNDTSVSPALPETWVHTAFTAGQKSVLVLRELMHTSTQLNQSGAVPVAVIRQISDVLNFDPQRVSQIITVLKTAGLLAVIKSSKPGTSRALLTVTEEGKVWSIQPHAYRWLELVARFVTALPAGLRSALTDDDDTNNWRQANLQRTYPLITQKTHAEYTALLTAVESLAISDGETITPAVKDLLDGRIKEALSTVEAAFPQTVTGVIIQPDFSVIAAGPLTPRDGLRLLEISTVVTPGLASTFQITKDSLISALHEGWQPDEILAFLEDISLTPLPQPLRYLLGELPPGRKVETRSHSFTKSEASIAALQTHLTSQSSIPDWALRLAREIQEAKMGSRYSSIGYILELARRSRSTIRVTANIDGKEELFKLTPTAISNERLRAIDLDRELERVFPLRLITGVKLE